MVAVMFVLAIVAVLAGIFALVIQQMAGVRRQQYLYEVAADNLACTSLPELERKVERQRAIRKRTHSRLAGHSHSGLIER
ncbi:hypothetical protein [Neorhizobium sp. LjRoot104]|uniref:hypothetical protein n=1 Tax=Neorhizobium sp. LjRoot104 TaxID=3342254 RepID=UPI003ED0DD85